MRFSTAIRLFFPYFSLFFFFNVFFFGRIPSANFNKISKTHPSSVERESRYVRIHPLTPIRVKNNVFNIDKREKCENNNRKFLLTTTASPKPQQEQNCICQQISGQKVITIMDPLLLIHIQSCFWRQLFGLP